MTGGVVTGGWGFVWAAYLVTGAAFLIYGMILVVNLRQEIARAEKNGEAE
jgi:hypothetical protein